MGSLETATGPVIESCAILTSKPNELLGDVHDRMPVILQPEKYQEWLIAPSSACGILRALLQPFDRGHDETISCEFGSK